MRNYRPELAEVLPAYQPYGLKISVRILNEEEQTTPDILARLVSYSTESGLEYFDSDDCYDRVEAYDFEFMRLLPYLRDFSQLTEPCRVENATVAAITGKAEGEVIVPAVEVARLARIDEGLANPKVSLSDGDVDIHLDEESTGEVCTIRIWADSWDVTAAYLRTDKDVPTYNQVLIHTLFLALQFNLHGLSPEQYIKKEAGV